MATYRGIVETCDRDSFDLRAQCEEAVNDWLLGEPAGLDESEREELAEQLRRRFLRTLHPRTTGADALSVAVVPVEMADAAD